VFAILADLDVVGVPVLEPEADPPPVVDRDRILALAIAPQPMQPVAWGNLEIIKACREVHVLKLARGSAGHIRREPSGLSSQVDLLGPLVRERLDHVYNCNASRDTCQTE